jgi:hypothetical protein
MYNYYTTKKCVFQEPICKGDKNELLYAKNQKNCFFEGLLSKQLSNGIKQRFGTLEMP